MLHEHQEAVIVGQEAALKKTDSVITAHRDHHQLAQGDTPESVIGELMGKEIGYSRGKGGSRHVYNPEHNFKCLFENGIVGPKCLWERGADLRGNEHG